MGGGTFQDPQQTPETPERTTPQTQFSLHIHTYDQVSLNQSGPVR